MISANVIIISVAGRLEEIYRAAYEVDFADSFTIRWLLRLRGISSENFSLRGIERSIFRKLGENPGGELVFGLIGGFCTIFGDLEAIRSTPDFCEFQKPGCAKAVWNFSIIEEGDKSRLTTEIRIRWLDEASRLKFGRYWALIRPFSGLIRMEMLKFIKRKAEVVL